MLAIKSIENLDTSNNEIVSLSCDKVPINPSQKITLIDYDTIETKIIYRYNTLVYNVAIFKTCETFIDNRKFDIDITKVIGYCKLNKVELKPCSRKLYKLLDCIERIDVLTDGGGIVITRASIVFYDVNSIFGNIMGLGDFDVSDLITIASLVDNDRLIKMIDDGIIYITNNQVVIKIVLVKNENIRRIITKLITVNNNRDFINTVVASGKMRKIQKSISYGVSYGMGAMDLANKMFGKQV